VPPTGSVVTQVAGVVVLLAMASLLVLALRDRGNSWRRMNGLGRAQTVAAFVTAVGLGVAPLVDSEVVVAIWVVGVFVTLAVTLVRWRRREPVFPSWF
jgi:uncharacterized membrane protein YhaH (DUF805 family)